MRGRLFSLVHPDDEDDVYGWGVEFVDVERPRAVIMLPDDDQGHVSLGVHDSADGALRCWERLEPLNLRWLS